MTLGPRVHQVPARAGPGQRADHPGLDRQVVLARLPAARRWSPMMMDYMLPKRVMSWKEAWEIYFEEQNGGALFHDLARYGIRVPKHLDRRREEGPHQPPGTGPPSTTSAHAAAFHTWIPAADEIDWLSENYPDTFDQLLPPRCGDWGEQAAEGQPLLQQDAADALPDLPDPDGVHRARRPDHDLLSASSEYRATVPLLLRRLQGHLRPTSRRSTCRRGCRCTRSTRATASSRAPTRRPKASIPCSQCSTTTR